MRLIWNGHACFTLETAQGTLVTDPYGDGSVPGLSPVRLTADAVYCSHGHSDHNAAQLVALTGKDLTISVEELPTFHDDQKGALRGENVMRIFSAEGMRVAHLGDLGCRLTPEQLERISGCDAIMAPAGGILTIEPYAAYELCLASGARLVLPMHYGGGGLGNRRLRPVEEFTSLFTDRPVRRYEGGMGFDEQTPAQVALFAPPGARGRD